MVASNVGSSHVAWGSIELLHNVVRTLEFLDEQGQPLPVVRYRAKVKLHGSNCAVQVHPGGLTAQSRTAILTPESDYKGFAAWVRAHADYFMSLQVGTVVFGEWCGPGVEKGMAISQVADKVFAVFAVRDGDRVIHEPDELRARLPAAGAPATLHVLPWEDGEIAVDYRSRAALDTVAAALNERVAAVEHEDPWVKRTFGISGLGEGLVFYPVEVDGAAASADPDSLARLMFKAKGEKHRTAGTKTAVQVDASVVGSVAEFVALMVTEPRLQQGVTTVCDGVVDAAHTGKFLAWLVADVRKESVAELAASGLTWQQVEKAVQQRARAWYLAQRGSG
jgi:hypothetical protein